MENETHTLAIYLIALAILQGNGKTYVNHEITDVLERMKIELGL